MVSIPLQLIILLILFLLNAIATLIDWRPPLGQLVSLGRHRLHLHCQGQGDVTVVIDSSLGGLEGYLLQDALAQFTKVCIYDRAGYGWSDHSPYPRSSQQVVAELDALLTRADVEPPYILVGDSFGSYNMRLYAHQYPDKVRGLVLTDGLHEAEMLKMPWTLKALKLFFISGFLMSVLGSAVGLVRLIGAVRGFELLKPSLKRFPPRAVNPIKRSFYRPKHWITMTREMMRLDQSGEQLKAAMDLGDLPIISIKSASFFTPTMLTSLLPLRTVNQLRDRIHERLLNLSTHTHQIQAPQSSHFVWVDEPEIIVRAVQQLLGQDVRQ